jgi:hypothetical protein
MEENQKENQIENNQNENKENEIENNQNENTENNQNTNQNTNQDYEEYINRLKKDYNYVMLQKINSKHNILQFDQKICKNKKINQKRSLHAKIRRPL